MQVKLGEKIKELRKRDGRKQEDLAVALGVTNQAVSRWEANGGYPDIEMLPAIANYFHITIDDLFGYDNDRQTKLQSYVDQADQMGKCGDDSELRVEFLRNAISEFPSEWQLQYRLADALVAMGYQKYKVRAMAAEGGNDIRKDAEAKYKECLKEAISLNEEVLKKEIDEDARMFVISALLWLYSYVGDLESAERTALSQSPVRISREVLLARAAEGEKGEEYSGEAILALMHQLFRELYLTKNHLQANSQAALDTFLAAARLYESMIDDGNFGMHHNDMCMLYLRCSSAAIHLDDPEGASNYLEIALEHFIKFKQVMKMPRMPQFTAPLVSKAKSCITDIFVLDRKLVEEHMQSFPAECADAIRNNPKYASIFAE